MSRPSARIGSFAVGLVVGQALSAATTPLLTRKLGAAAFGVVEVLSVVVTLATALLLLGLDQAMVRFYFHDEGDEQRNIVVSSGFWMVVAASVIGCGLAAPWAGPLARALLGHTGRARLVWAALASILPAVWFSYLVEAVRVEGRVRPYTWLGIVRGATSGLAGLALVFAAKEGAIGVILGLAIGSAVGVAYAVVVVRGRLHHRPSRSALRDMVRYGLPLVPASLSFWSLLVIDRIVLAHQVSLRQIGFYALGNKISLLLLWAVYGFRAGWNPAMLDHHARDPADERRQRAEWLQQSVALALLGAAVLGALSTELTIVGGGHSFHSAARVVPLIVIALVLYSSTTVVQAAMVIAHTTAVIARHTLIAAAVNLVACVLLVPPWGIYGAAAATIIGFAYLSVASYVSAQRIERVVFQPWRLAATAFVVAPYLLLGQVQVGPLVVSVVVKVATLAVLPFAFARFGLLPLGGVGSLRSAARRVTGRPT